MITEKNDTLPSSFLEKLKAQSIQIKLVVLVYREGVEVRHCCGDLSDGARLSLPTGEILVRLNIQPHTQDGHRVELTFQVLAGVCQDIALGLDFNFMNWSDKDWLFLPACVYSGNRFPKNLGRKGIPFVPEADPVNWVKISNVPHLNCEPGPSRLQVLTGDCSTPCIGVVSPVSQRGFLLLTDQGTDRGDHGLEVMEDEDRRSAHIILKSPGVREGGKYNYKGSLSDKPMTLNAGEAFSLRASIYQFSAAGPEDLYARFVGVRKEWALVRERLDLPFRSAFQLIEEKHNRDNWVEAYGYWSVGMRESASQNFQTGWVGGPNTIWPLLISGNATSFQRALRAWDFIVGSATPSGFVKGCFHNGVWQNEEAPCYLRYSSDTLYFLMKTLLHLRVGPPHIDPNPAWVSFARALAEAFIAVWKKSGHLPHYADPNSGESHLGGSCAAALAPAALALAALYFKEPDYLNVAQQAARRYRDHFLAKGLTNGGPGDIYQNVDSESAAALLESFVVIMEETKGDIEWVEASERAAAYVATWVTSYDFRFPPNSTFGKLDMLSTGTVWANVQNKHAAPGICTLSGSSLFKLWRATDDTVWLDLIRDLARCLPQYVSRSDRPIPDTRPGKRWKVMPPGWVNERVNLSDWEIRGLPEEQIGVGEIFGGSCWSEPAILNTIAEVPGIVLNTDTLDLTVIDHVYAQIHHSSPESITLRLTNPTAFEAAPVLLAETSSERRQRWLGVHPLAGLPALTVPPFGTVDFRVLRAAPTRQSGG